jgi:hypothetical protein
VSRRFRKMRGDDAGSAARIRDPRAGTCRRDAIHDSQLGRMPEALRRSR